MPWEIALNKEGGSERNWHWWAQDFVEGVGDRRQELVFIGIDMRRDEIVQALDACLLTKGELASPQLPLPDPFAEWPR